MRAIPERQQRSLIPASAGDGLRVARIDGRKIEDWPARIETAHGSVLVERDGSVAFLPAGAGAARLDAGQTARTVEFSYTLWDGQEESRLFRAAIEVEATAQGAARGWRADWDSGLETGDFYVDATRGSDANSGRSIDSPKRTVQAALDEMDARGGQTLLLRGGTYREPVTFDRFTGADKDTVISRYRDEPAVISGATELTGLVPCTPDDAAYIGEAWRSTFRTVFATSPIAHDRLESLGLREGDTPITLATDFAGGDDDFLFGATETFHTADQFIERDDKIIEIRHAAVFSRYSPEQLRQAVGVVWQRGNRLKRFAIGDLDETVDNAIRPAVPPDVFVSGEPRFWRYSLRNSLISMVPGRWSYRITEDNGTILYVWPNDPATALSDLVYAGAPRGWDLNSASHLRFQGLSFRDFGGTGRSEGIALGTISGRSRERTNRAISIHNCRFSHIYNIETPYGVLNFADIDGLHISNTTIETSQNAGLFLSRAKNVRIAGCLFDRLTHAGMSVFNTHNAVISYTDLRRIARVAHANVANFYATPKQQGIDLILLYGLRVSDANGYLTWQGSSRVDMAFCDIAPPSLRRDVRSVVDQSTERSAPPPSPGQTGFLWNNLLRHNPDELDGAGGVLSLGRPGVDVFYALLNNVIGGGGIITPYVKPDPGGHNPDRARVRNLYTKLAWWQDAKNGWRLDRSEALIGDLTQVFESRDASGFRLRDSGLLAQIDAYDMSDLIVAELQARYPGFDFSRDIDGNAFDWKNAAIGPFQVDWNLQIR